MTFGVYFSANDKVLPWVMAFLHSFRESNPTLALYLIPFNDQSEQIIGLRRQFNFQIFEDDSFAALEELGQRYELGITSYGKHWFRRYAAFWGPLDQFAYFDARQLILGDLSDVFAAIDRLKLDLIHFDTAINQVYEPGPHRDEMVSDRRGVGFLSGAWFARRGVFSLSDLIALGDESLRIREQMNPRNTDQAFINYCCDKREIRMAHVADVFCDVCRNSWSRQPGSIYRDCEGQYRIWDHGGLDHRKRVVLLHWAGIRLSPVMPHRRLFLSFLKKGRSLPNRMATQVIDMLLRPLLSVKSWLHRNRHANTIWHSLRSWGR